jgi:hypothetical protein
MAIPPRFPPRPPTRLNLAPEGPNEHRSLPSRKFASLTCGSHPIEPVPPGGNSVLGRASLAARAAGFFVPVERGAERKCDHPLKGPQAIISCCSRSVGLCAWMKVKNVPAPAETGERIKSDGLIPAPGSARVGVGLEAILMPSALLIAHTRSQISVDIWPLFLLFALFAPVI